MANLRDAGGRFVSSSDYGTITSPGHGANLGSQTWGSTAAMPTGVTLNKASLEALLQHPAVVATVVNQTEAMLKQANGLAITEDAEYGAIVYNNRPELGPVGVVFCDNYKSVVDDAYHGTLHKVIANAIAQGGLRS